MQEIKRDDALFRDEYAEKFGGEGAAQFLKFLEQKIQDEKIRKSLTERNTHFVLREKFFEDFLQSQIQNNQKQFVIGASGLDSRAFRFKWPSDSQIFEIDRKEIIDYKEKKIKELELKPTCRRVAISADLTKDDWKYQMEEKGFKTNEPSVWVFCGLFPYLDQPMAKDLLARVASFCGPNSIIAFDVPEAIETETNKEIRLALKEWDAPLLCSIPNVRGILEEYGWHVIELMKPGDEKMNFGRWSDEQDKGLPWDGLFVVAKKTSGEAR